MPDFIKSLNQEIERTNTINLGNLAAAVHQDVIGATRDALCLENQTHGSHLNQHGRAQAHLERSAIEAAFAMNHMSYDLAGAATLLYAHDGAFAELQDAQRLEPFNRAAANLSEAEWSLSRHIPHLEIR